MKTNKETRMISSDEIFYAVLQDGTVVSNFRETVESMAEEHSVGLARRRWTSVIPFLKRQGLSLPLQALRLDYS